MSALPRGLYENVLTDLLAERLRSHELAGEPKLEKLRDADAADRLAVHLSWVIERAIEGFPEKQRASLGAQLSRTVVETIVRETRVEGLRNESPQEPPQLLHALRRHLPDGSLGEIGTPLIPLLDTTLLTNAPGEPRVSHQLLTEIESADAIDLVMAFIRRSGITPFRERIRRHCEAGRAFRVLTTTYTGSTEAEALDLLRELGADVRVSYDTSATRLHAKAWLFHRDSGFSTAYVGSSNLTHSAQVSGLEWNVRVSGARNRAIIDKIAAVFDSYWEQQDFERYERERFLTAIRADRTSDSTFTLSPLEIRLDPFQERLLEQIELAREGGHHRNLLVSATGTGKTVMAAVDYARLRSRLPRARLLFVAHRKEILEQSRRTFAHALRDANFGEMWVGGERPTIFDHVFASIQSIAAAGIDALEAEHFDVVIIDEFHHAAATTYERLLQRVKPQELLGLTATPERGDGQSVLHWFDGRIAAELRLWDAIDQHRLAPFAYFGISDALDLREIPWKRGTGYDVEELTNVITSTDVWARRVLQQFKENVGRIDKARALGFCVSVDHARYMSRVFERAGVKSVAVWAETDAAERARVLTDLTAGRINVVFSVDLFNEGVDVPTVDTLLMLRPTESPLLFLQQLGRGLRKSPGKSVCTVLDFVGQHRKEFRYDRRFQALLGGSRASVIRQVERGFPFLPAGCHMELDRVAAERVIENIRGGIPTRLTELVAELRSLAVERPGLALGEFLSASGLELEEVYKNNRSWTDLRELAALHTEAKGGSESELRRACGRLLHVDDRQRLQTWRGLLVGATVPDVGSMSLSEQRSFLMLLVQLLGKVASADSSLQDGADLLWSHPQIRSELIELFDVLTERIQHVSKQLHRPVDVPLQVHARYTRQEILCACGVNAGVRERPWREGVYFAAGIHADLFVFTLDKTSGGFSPTTRYRDYAISRDLVHWESQSGTRADSPTGQRYQDHAKEGSQILLFGRPTADDRAFHFLGPATYVTHKGEMPMAITWRLEHPLPGDLYQMYAAAVA